MKNRHILKIKKLMKNDSAEYTFRHQTEEGGQKQSDLPGVTLVVTGLRVKFTPSAEVTEGQRVTLTCRTSCPLTDNTNYIWYLNTRPLTLPENQNKHLVLDPVSSQHAGNYSCAVKNSISSHERTLTVQGKSMAIINAVRLTIALMIPIPLLLFHLWMRKKKTLTSTAEPSDQGKR
ncbi:sialoadhesin-like [Micropterus salmoides]|uniref:sialoadhesin-like n=1 Tax=Micropterus salmoides TaxID=27706 RepID=UPI0018EDC57A|nr:sialoadhesin-like [Micropterus salmoides]